MLNCVRTKVQRSERRKEREREREKRFVIMYNMYIYVCMCTCTPLCIYITYICLHTFGRVGMPSILCPIQLLYTVTVIRPYLRG